MKNNKLDFVLLCFFPSCITNIQGYGPHAIGKNDLRVVFILVVSLNDGLIWFGRLFLISVSELHNILHCKRE